MNSTNRQNAGRPVNPQYKTTPVQKDAGRQAGITVQEVMARYYSRCVTPQRSTCYLINLSG